MGARGGTDDLEIFRFVVHKIVESGVGTLVELPVEQVRYAGEIQDKWSKTGFRVRGRNTRLLSS